jgi:excisionase family DNA binding protein
MDTARRTAGGASTLPRLISVEEAATLLAVTDTTVRNWIKADAIPYVELPGTGQRRRCRIPLQGLLNTLTGNYDLASDVEYLDAVFGGAARSEDESPEDMGSRARPGGGSPTEVEGNPRDLFAHAQGRTLP